MKSLLSRGHNNANKMKIMFREDLKKIKITQLVESTLKKNIQNLQIKFPNKKGINE